MSAQTKLAEIGVVVIGRNEGERLIACLASVKSKAACIVYVDSGSTDGSARAAERLGVSVIKLDSTRPFTASRARNEGFAALKALEPNIRFVQFIDGDCELVGGWLEEARSFLVQREDVVVVCGRRRERYPERSVYNRLCDLEWDTPIGEASACGGDSLLRAEAYEAAGGFQPQLIAGEEPELCVRLRERGWKIWRLDAEMTIHDAAMTRFGQWWARAVRSGYGYAQVSQLHRQSSFRIYARETGRAVFWGGLVPLAIGLGALLHPIILFGTLIYPLQVLRIVYGRGAKTRLAWAYAVFVVIGKFAELKGTLAFYWHSSRRQNAKLDYKKTN